MIRIEAARVLIFLAVWLVADVGAASPPAVLRIASYNVANYCLANRMTDDGYKLAYPKPEKAKNALRAVLRSIDADIVGLQEMGAEPYLTELLRDLKKEGLEYPYFALGDGLDPERHVAIISKIPFEKTHFHRDLEFRYFGEVQTIRRGALEATVRTEAGAMTLWVVHLKSKLTENERDPEADTKRSAEAVAIRERLLKRRGTDKNALYLIMGDFNDSKDSRPLRAFQAKGKAEIACLLPATDPQGDHWTFYNARKDAYERLDHILISPALARAASGRKPPAAEIARMPEVLVASDHRPLFVTLEFLR